jgi:hypothetical protein
MKNEQSMKTSIVLVAATALAVASCGSRGAAGDGVNAPDGAHPVAASTEVPVADTGGGGASCDAVMGKMADMMRVQMDSYFPEDKQELADRMQVKIMEAMFVSCNEDQWPDEVKTCIMDAKDDKAMDECGDKGGEEFEDKVRKRMTPVMEEMMKEMAAEFDSPPSGEPPVEGDGGEEASD